MIQASRSLWADFVDSDALSSRCTVECDFPLGLCYKANSCFIKQLLGSVSVFIRKASACDVRHDCSDDRST